MIIIYSCGSCKLKLVLKKSKKERNKYCLLNISHLALMLATRSLLVRNGTLLKLTNFRKETSMTLGKVEKNVKLISNYKVCTKF